MSPQPLASLLRPKSFQHFFGQSHLVGTTGPLLKLASQNAPLNVIFWGPPGVGKTSLALLLNEAWDTQWNALNATLASIQDIKKVIETAKENRRYGQKTVLFIDEIHRFSKTQQDTLLSVVENGTLYLMGATTENPRFSVIPGLVSRALIFECKALEEKDLIQVLLAAWGQAIPTHPCPPELQIRLTAYAAGDARKLCNAVEFLSRCYPDKNPITLADLEGVLPEASRSLDDTTHYDLSSALIKSMRGSDPDAALYWLARLLESGEDPVFIARRMVIFSSEDIGNADPQALILATAAMQSAKDIGMPESRIILGQLATYLSTAPKSNASYMAIESALGQVRAGDIQGVPHYLRTAQSPTMSSTPKSGSYLYPHNYPYAVVQQSYWDESKTFYHPKSIGFEREINKRMDWIRNQKKPN